MLKNFISFPHYDNLNESHDASFYHLFKNSTQSFKEDIHDIYFGKVFHYEFNGISKKYGNAMGVEASDIQIDYLFKIQEEYGIPISLTLNSLETPHELLYSEDLIKQFISFIGSLYERGLRSCILASNHLIKSKILHKNFPEIRWKSTVNQRCLDAQSVIDLCFNGYDTIMLDRRLNRDIKELRKIKKAVDYYNEKYKPDKKVLTCLLVSESCVYNCPFKKEHDSIGEYISTDYFKSLSKLTCDNWRYSDFGMLPRNGIDIITSTKESWNEYANLVDIFKFSGRLTKLPFNTKDTEHMKLSWILNDNKIDRLNQKKFLVNEIMSVNSFSEVIDNNLIPIHGWVHGWTDNRIVDTDVIKIKNKLEHYDSIWKTDKGMRLEKILKTCKSQCWDCHECEKAFETEYYDSSLQL